MPGRYYLDTNPLMRWSESMVAAPEQRCVKVASELETLINDSTCAVSVSETTVGEFLSNVSKHQRGAVGVQAQCDRGWAEAVTSGFMRWLAGGHVHVMVQPPKALEHGLGYVKSATDEHGRSFQVWDAMHLYQAAYWARSENGKVHLITGDPDFVGLLESFPEFRDFVELLDLEKV